MTESEVGKPGIPSVPDMLLENIWIAQGGRGPAPPLYVSERQFDMFVAGGVSPSKMRVTGLLPAGKVVFFDPEKPL